MASQRALRLGVGTAALALAAGCGHASQNLVTAAQVQNAFARAGLTTRILIDCKPIAKVPAVPGTCPLKGLGATHAIAVIGDFRAEVKTPYGAPVEALAFDSARAADKYEVANTIFDPKTGKTFTPTMRLQRRNVVVYVTRRGEYRRKAAAALAALG